MGDGRLCAAAFVQDRQAYTGCTETTNPAGESGRPWCYAEAQLVEAGSAMPPWGYCAPVVDYDALREMSASVFATKVTEVRTLIAKMQKAQRLAETALDMYERKCGA